MTANGLYTPVIVKKELDDEHFYYVDGKFFPSVTKILQETLPMPIGLRLWIGDVGNEKAEQKMETAALQGTLIHAACERLLRGEEINLLEEFPKRGAKKMLTGFVNWFAKYQPRRLVINKVRLNPELTLASKHGYAGTADFVCNINDEPWVIDWKTSKGIYESHKIQVTSYQNAIREMYGITPKRGILHLNPLVKDGYSFITEEKMTIKDNPITIDDFLLVLKMYKMLNGGKLPEPDLVTKYPDTLRLEQLLDYEI